MVFLFRAVVSVDLKLYLKRIYVVGRCDGKICATPAMVKCAYGIASVNRTCSRLRLTQITASIWTMGIAYNRE